MAFINFIPSILFLALPLIATLGLTVILMRFDIVSHNSKQKYKTVAPKFLTVRISNIPRKINRERFRSALNNLPIMIAQNAGQPNYTQWSYSPAAASNLAKKYWVATVTFVTCSPLNKLETALRAGFGMNASRLKVDEDFLGLTPLAYVDPPTSKSVE